MASGTGRRIQVRRSGVHGKGVFALTDIAQGDRIIEYVGEVITWKEALRRHPHDPAQPNHTFYFHLDDGHVIDALYGGNASRWINHSCEPNCEADEEDGHIYIKALRDIHPGEELNYDYGLVIDAPLTAKLKAEYPCWCGSPHCRGTLLSSSQPTKPGHQPARKKSARGKTAPSKPRAGKTGRTAA
jgi:SET domain-containing protein